MALTDVLNTLTARRDRFRELLAVKSVEVPADASLKQCLEALANLFGVIDGDVAVNFYGERLPAKELLIQLPATIDSIDDVDQEGLVLVMRDHNGQRLTDSDGNATYRYLWYDGGIFQDQIITNVAQGQRLLVMFDHTIPAGQYQIQLVPDYHYVNNNPTIYLEMEIDYDGLKTPLYFQRPSGSGNYKLLLNGNAVDLEVYHGGEWVDSPAEGLSADYTHEYIRIKGNVPDRSLACWECDGEQSDLFWYVI